MAEDQLIRVGVIGAGGICKQRHLPGLTQLEDVDLTAVCNRSEASARAVAEQWSIDHIETDWRKLVERDDVDAVVIGTWPYTHQVMAEAALQAGKHVFCQARMACDLAEARSMVQAAEAHPQQVAMLCPPPHRMPWEPWIRAQLDGGALGELYDVRLVSINDANLNAQSITFREQIEYSGKQALQVGIWAETLIAWLGEVAELSATTATPIPTKRDEGGKLHEIRIPQTVIVDGVLENGATIGEHHSGLARHEHGNYLTMHGSEATLRVDAMQQVSMGKRGEPMQPVQVPIEMQRDWRVERDFIEAVRKARAGEAWSVDPDFHQGLKYMKKVEAIDQAARTGQRVNVADQ
jgi:predicted dehydrogenase